MAYSIKNILWATDFSAEAANALAYAEVFARTFGAEITVIHVLPEIQSTMIEARPMYLEELYAQIDKSEKKAVKTLEALVRKKAGLRFRKVLTEKGSPVKKIIEAAVREKSDLIVMGKKGLSAVEKILVGSVTNGVLRHSPAPVLIAPRKKLRPRIGKILVPTDFSEREEIERRFAWILASAFKADLTLLHVMELYNYRVPPESAEAMLCDIQARLKKREVREKKAFKVDEAVVRDINAAAGIVNYAQSKAYDLISISTYKHTGLARFFLGSTTERVISLSDVPVFALPAACSED
jgi:nucleotide-binding universal stress UspA family protein